MRAHLTINDSGGPRTVELPKTQATFGSADSCEVRVFSEDQRVLATLAWDPRQTTWLMRPTTAGVAAVTVNARVLEHEGPVPLSTGDVLEFPGGVARFQRLPAEPAFRGTATSEVPLAGLASVVLGRKDVNATTADDSRVDLDAEDIGLSKIHATVERVGEDYFLSDLSKLGTELNGKAFTKEKLVYGDRFRIRDYIIEFTGTSLRRVDRGNVGSVSARSLTVEVPTRTGRLRILSNLSIEIGAGEFIGILGGSGQGKSTLLGALCGISPASSGEVFVSGIPLSDRKRIQSAGLGFVPQDDIVHRELRVREAITYSARLRLALPPAQIDALVDRVIDRLSLTEHRDKVVAQLSGGQRKRVSIAIELLARPSVLFLDEPSSGLDPAIESDLMALLQSLRLTNLTVVCTTHMLQKAYLFDRVVFIQGGRLVFVGTADEAREHFLMRGTAGTRGLLDKSPLEKIYTLLADTTRTGEKSAEEWENEFLESRFARRQLLIPEEPATAKPPPPGAAGAASKARSGYLKPLWLLLSRQWRILLADRLNLLFLLAQALAIGLMIGWVADNAGLRMFLCVVATLWFGCSNGAQQIVGELPIFRRERICGLGLNTYVQSKLVFLSLLTMTQSILLFGTVLASSHLLHPQKFDAKVFGKLLVEKLQPPGEVRTTDSEEEFVAATADSKPEAKLAAARASSAPAKPKPPVVSPPSGAYIAFVTLVARTFYLKDNIIEAFPQARKDSQRNEMMAADGRPIRDAGLGLWRVILTALGLKLFALMSAAVVGVALGLAISALVRSSTQAVMWVPLILIPQILFGGVVVSVPEMSRSAYLFSKWVPSFCAQRIMDVSNIYGQRTPRLSNRTKIPLFFSGEGEAEDFEWKEIDANGRTISPSAHYDKLTLFNSSWQNLLVRHELVGQHLKVSKRIEGSFTEEAPDTTEKRRDVVYLTGIQFAFLGPAQFAALILAGWLALCYGTAVLSLANKQTGKP